MSQPHLPIRVRPGASRTAVGGAWPGADSPSGPALCVAVTARAVDGAANRAVLQALAEALGVRPRQLTIVVGERGRSKVVAVSDPPGDLDERLRALLGR